MNEKDLLSEHVGNRVRAGEFIRQKTSEWVGTRRLALQLLAAGAGACATMTLPALARGNVASASEAGAKGTSKQPKKQLEPNLFELQGYNTQITYSTTSITGVPQFSYSDRDRNRTFSGSEIQSEETGLGRIVTVLLENGAADGPIESLTLLLPIVQLSPQVKELPIQTLAIFSSRAVFVIPANPGQLQTYNTLSLYGTARQVQF